MNAAFIRWACFDGAGAPLKFISPLPIGLQMVCGAESRAPSCRKRLGRRALETPSSIPLVFGGIFAFSQHKTCCDGSAKWEKRAIFFPLEGFLREHSPAI
jgi:hypothetical protein